MPIPPEPMPPPDANAVDIRILFFQEVIDVRANLAIPTSTFARSSGVKFTGLIVPRLRQTVSSNHSEVSSDSSFTNTGVRNSVACFEGSFPGSIFAIKVRQSIT
jgi:hypothetical protein